jgi:chromosome segregation ATPase
MMRGLSLSTICSQEQVSELKNLRFSSNLMQMVDVATLTIDALFTDGSMLAQVGADKCKLAYLLITSNQRRVESLIRFQCQASSCASENTRLLSKIAALEAELKAKAEHAQKEKAQLESEKAGLQATIVSLQKELKSEKSEVARVKGLLDETSSNHDTCQSNIAKVKSQLDACNRNHETSQAGYNECKLQIQKIDGTLEGEKKELSKCLAREQVVLKGKATIEGKLTSEAVSTARESNPMSPRGLLFSSTKSAPNSSLA